jgi:hypothetical protein
VSHSASLTPSPAPRRPAPILCFYVFSCCCSYERVAQTAYTGPQAVHWFVTSFALRFHARPTLSAATCSCCCSYERVAEGQPRVIVVVNAARGYWQDGNYSLWVGGGGSFKQVYCSQVRPAAVALCSSTDSVGWCLHLLTL